MSADALSDHHPQSEFWRGFRRGIPVVVASAPFGLLFGAVAVDNGFTVGEAVLMSAAIYGGASQMVGIELFGNHVAPWLVVLSIFAVNFRHILYSAAVGPRISHWPPLRQALGFFFLVDPQYAEAEIKGERGEVVSFAWYMGMASPIYACWVTEAWLGATFGSLIPNPQALGLDFLLPIYFLGLVMGFRNRPLWLPVVAVSAVASVIAYNTVGSPWHVSIGALAGILLAAAMPLRANGEGPEFMSTTVWIILASAVATYLTRVGGHLVLSRFERIHPRIEAGLNAVPAAVLTTLVAPVAVGAGPAEMLALLVAGLVALRGGMITMFLAGAAVLVALRQVMG